MQGGGVLLDGGLRGGCSVGGGKVAEGRRSNGVGGVQWWAGCGVGMVARRWDGFLADFAECAEWL